MAVKRIVANIENSRPADAKAFYGDILGMDVAMDHDWIITFASDAKAVAQVSIASEGGAQLSGAHSETFGQAVTTR